MIESPFFVPGGTVPLNSESYIERAADRQLLNHLLAGDYCYVLNARQMGKSSLSLRTISKLSTRGVRTVFIDLTQLGGANLRESQWYAGLTSEIGRALDLDGPMLEYFRAHEQQSHFQRLFSALRDVVLSQIPDPVVIFIDEIDATRNLLFDTDEFFAGIRECYNRRVRDEAFHRLTFCLIGVAVPADLIQNPLTTPFNIGERVRVEDFTLIEVKSFGRALGPNGNTLAGRVHYWTSGQPFLTQALCQAIVSERIETKEGVDRWVERMFFDPRALATNSNLVDVAKRVLNDPIAEDGPERFRADLLHVYDRVLRGGTVKDDEANRIAVVLKLAGLLRVEGARLVIRNRIYRRVFDRAWVRANMPGQEQIRQRRSFRQGLLRGLALTSAVVVVIGTFLVFLLFSRAKVAAAERRAVAAEARLDYDLYVSDMNSLRLYEETGNAARMSAILARWQASPHRGFEWDLWMARLHDSPEEYALRPESRSAEQGFVSPDGHQICLVDTARNYGVVIDRRTNLTIGSAPVPHNFLTATSSGFLTFDQDRNPAPISNVATGKIVGQVGGGRYSYRPARREQGDFMLLLLTNRNDHRDRMFEVWDFAHGRRRYRSRIPNSVELGWAISQDGRRFIYSENRGTAPPLERSTDFVVFDWTKNREVDRFSVPQGWRYAALSPSGRRLAFWTEGHFLAVRDVDGHRFIYKSPESADNVFVSVEIATDDHSMVCVNSDGIGTWRELPSGRVRRVIPNVRTVWPADGKSLWVAAGSSVRLLGLAGAGVEPVISATHVARDGLEALRFYSNDDTPVSQLSDPALKPLPTPPPPKAGAIDFTYNRRWAMVRAAKESRFISADGSAPPIDVPMAITNFACGIRNDVIVAVDVDDLLHGLAGPDGRPLWTRHYPQIAAFWMTPDDRLVIATKHDGSIITLDPLNGGIVGRVAADLPPVTALNFSRDGQMFATGESDGEAILWDTATLTKRAEFRGNADVSVTSVDISPDRRRVVTCNSAGAWQIWDAATGAELTEFRTSNLPLRSIVFTADGKKLVTAGDDNVVRVWKGIDRDPTVTVGR